MNCRSIPGRAALAAVVWLLVGCAAAPPAGVVVVPVADAVPAPALDVRQVAVDVTTPAAAAPALQTPPAVLRSALYAYEAEAAAKAQGCATQDGVRPRALLRMKRGQLEEFDLQCTAGPQRMRCDMGACRRLS